MAKKVDCSELSITLTEIFMNIGSRKGFDTVDKITAEMKKELTGITREGLVIAVNEATSHGERVYDEIAEQRRKLMLEVRADPALKKTIKELDTALKEGKVPAKVTKARNEPAPAIAALRKVRDELRKKVRGSDPVQREKVAKQIDVLTERLEKGIYEAPKKRVATPESRELSEMTLKRDHLRHELRRQINKLKPRGAIVRVLEPFNISRSIKASFDLSAPRQAAPYLIGSLTSPKRLNSVRKAFGKMLRATFSEAKYVEMHRQLLETHAALLYERHAGFLAHPDAALSGQEEIYMSQYGEYVPGVRQSNRAFVTFLNHIRVAQFESMLENFVLGDPTAEQAKDLSNLTNVMSGRGGLGGFEGSATALNTGLWAPRYVASRFQFALFHPLWRKGGDAMSKKIIAKEYARFFVGLAMLFSMAALAGWELMFDPTSADFFKIRKGRVVLDPVGGLSQVTRFMAKVVTGTKRTDTGSALPGFAQEWFGKSTAKYSKVERGRTMHRFLRSKLAPSAATLWNTVEGKDFAYRNTDIRTAEGRINTLSNLTMPLAMSDVYEAIKEEGVPAGSALGILAIFGVGLQIYSEKAKKRAKKTAKLYL